MKAAVASAASQMPITGMRAMRAGGVEPGVVEAGDDGGVGAFALAPGDLDQQARHRQRLVVVALDRDRPHREVTATISRRRRGHRARRRGDRLGHRGGGVGIDDEDAHAGQLRPGRGGG